MFNWLKKRQARHELERALRYFPALRTPDTYADYRKHIERALELDPDNLLIRYNRAIFMENQDEALDELELIIRRNPRFPFAYGAYGLGMLVMGFFLKACEILAEGYDYGYVKGIDVVLAEMINFRKTNAQSALDKAMSVVADLAIYNFAGLSFAQLWLCYWVASIVNDTTVITKIIEIMGDVAVNELDQEMLKLLKANSNDLTPPALQDVANMSKDVAWNCAVFVTAYLKSEQLNGSPNKVLLMAALNQSSFDRIRCYQPYWLIAAYELNLDMSQPVKPHFD